jgi:DNA-binding NarL/FixJ family response regulator
VKILMLTTFNDAASITTALRCGAKGYVLKDTPSKELAAIIRSIDQGYTQFSPGILEKMLTVMQPQTVVEPEPMPTVGESTPTELPPGFTELTSREREVLCLIAAGRSNKEIAEQLCVAEGTARNHISHILSRLNLRDRTQAAIVASNFLAWLENPDTSNLPN